MDELRVLCPVDALEWPGADAALPFGSLVQALLHGRDEMHDRALVPRHLARGHLARPEFANHLLGDDRVELRAVRVEVLEVQAGLQRVLVVAGDADRLHEVIRVLCAGRGRTKDEQSERSRAGADPSVPCCR